MDHTKLDRADLDSPRRELSVRGPGFVVQLDCSSVTQWDIVIPFAAEVRFKFRDQIRKPQPKLHVAM